MNDKGWLVVGALFGLTGVALGAFGAHGLEKGLAASGLDAGTVADRLGTWEVAVRYQIYHALALLILGVLATRCGTLSRLLSGIAFVLGVLIFSGCLYGYVLSGVKTLAMIVPVGGVLLIVGWGLLIVAVCQGQQE